MKKIISLVLALIIAMGSFSFAQPVDKYSAVGNELKNLGIITGQDGGDLKPYGQLTREQSLVVLSRMMGKEDEAKVTNFESGFLDVRTGNFYKPYIEYSKLKGWTKGVSSKKFGIGEPTTTKVMATFMLRALGYSADWKTEDIMAQARQIGLMNGVSAGENDYIIRGEVFIMMKNTLNTNSKNDNEKLIYKLNLASNPNKNDASKPVSETKPSKPESTKPSKPSSTGNRYGDFEVTNVRTENLKEIVVEFSKDVDSSTLKDAFVLNGHSISALTPSVSKEQNNLVIIQVASKLKNNENYKLRIRGVKSSYGDSMRDDTREFTTSDTTIPEIQNLEITGPKTFKIIFTEPIDYSSSSSNTVKIYYDNERRSISTSLSADPANLNVINVRASSNLREDVDYEVLVRGFRDYAGYTNIDAVKNLDYRKITDAPVATITKATEEYVVVSFSRPVKGLSLENFYHTYSAYRPFEAYKSEKDLLNNTNKLTNFSSTLFSSIALRFVNPDDFNSSNANTNRQHPLIEGNVRFMVLGAVGNRKVVDEWNNQLREEEFTIQITTNRTSPEIETVEGISDKQIDVSFTKPVILNKSNYEIRYSNGGRISGLSYYLKPVTEKKIGIVINSPSMKGKSVELRIRNVVDKTISRNKMDGEYTRTIEFGDKVFEGVKEVILKVGSKSSDEYYSNPTIVVAFKEDMDSSSTTDINNYRFTNDNGRSYFNLDSDTYMPYDSILEIRLTREIYETKFKNRKAMIMISQDVKDRAGNGYAGFSQSYEIKSSSASVPPKLSKENPASVSDRYTIKLNFDDLLSIENGGNEVNRDQFKIYNGEQRLDIDSVTIEGSTSLKIQLVNNDSNKLPSDIKELKIEFTDRTYRSGGLGNTQGVSVGFFTLQGKDMKDSLSPQYARHSDAPRYEYTMKDARYRVNGSDRMVIVKFDEEVVDSTFSSHTFKVELVNSSENVKVQRVAYGESKKEVVIYLKQVDGNEKISFDEAINAAFYSNDYFEGRSGRKYYKVMRIRVNDGNTIEDKYGNTATNDYVDVYADKKN